VSPVLHVHEFGPADGLPVLMVHGIMGHGGRWQRFAEEQLYGCRIIAPDLRGHGDSPHLPPWTLEQHAADLLSVLDSLRVTGLPVIGHAFGGAAAIHLARLAPQRVTRLILLDPSIGLDPAFALQAMSPWPHVFPTIEKAAEWQRNEWAGISLRDVEEELHSNFTQIAGRWMPRYHHPAVTTAWSEMCRAAQLPPPGTRTLLVHAPKAGIVRQTFIDACQVTMRGNLRLAELDCGHMMYLESPDAVGDLIAEFLDG
jgi:lipase